MFTRVRGSAIAAAFLLTIASDANAATYTGTQSITAGDAYASAAVLDSADEAIFTFTAATDLMIRILGVSATGSNGGSDLWKLMFGIGSATQSFTMEEVKVDGTQATGRAFVDFMATLMTGESFTFNFASDDSAMKPIAVGLSLTTLPVSPTAVPLPATGAALLAAIAGLGLVRRRRSASAA